MANDANTIFSSPATFSTSENKAGDLIDEGSPARFINIRSMNSFVIDCPDRYFWSGYFSEKYILALVEWKADMVSWTLFSDIFRFRNADGQVLNNLPCPFPHRHVKLCWFASYGRQTFYRISTHARIIQISDTNFRFFAMIVKRTNLFVLFYFSHLFSICFLHSPENCLFTGNSQEIHWKFTEIHWMERESTNVFIKC